MNGKKVVIYYGGFARFGGVCSHVRAIQSELQRIGCNVVVVSLDCLPIWVRFVPHFIEKIINFVNTPVGFFYKGLATKTLYRFFFNMYADVRIFEDIYLAWDSEIPSITILHAVWSDNLQAYSIGEMQMNKLKMLEAEVIEKIMQPVVTVSYPYLEYLKTEHFPVALSKKIEVIELGIDQSNFKRNSIKDKKSIVYSGTLEARKNVVFLLGVFKNLRIVDSGYRLTIIGDGPDRRALEKFAISNDLPVRFLGSLSHENVLAELHQHGIYLHTSVKESFSYSLLEAKLAGLKTCAYYKLQVPCDFLDVRICTFDIDDWCRGILNIDWSPKPFNADAYTIMKMTASTLRLAK